MKGNLFCLLIVSITCGGFVFYFDRWEEKAFLTFVVGFFKSLREREVKSPTRNNSIYNLPKDFLIGTSSSAYQIEGAWNEDGKSPSIWDDFVHFHEKSVDDHSNGDVSIDSYHHIKEDCFETYWNVFILYFPKFQHYRFSVSWTRILPNGSAVNDKGIRYYTKLIDTLISNGIEPMITIFHWDIPKWLQDLGGLTNPIFVDYFTAYADVLFHHFGSKVKNWMTVNEPFNLCTIGYGSNEWAPGIVSRGVGEYLCGHHLLLSHASAYHLYKNKYFMKQKGSIGITLDSRFYYPKNSSVTKFDLQRAQEYRLGWFAHPLFSESGGYPNVMVNEIEIRSKLEGRSFSRLPKFSNQEKAFIRGSSDFFGLNYYTSRLLSVDKTEHDPLESPAWFKDSRSLIDVNSTWKCAKSSWLYNVPEGLRDLLVWIKDEYNNPPVLITENGWSDEGELEDNGRIEYINAHLKELSKAINIDGCNIIGYTAWSLFDSFEWNRGFIEKFGLFSVNLTSPLKERVPKKSAYFLQKLIKERKLS
ncbi:CLUMA_CG009013, isoform A [Clunio marinus]|uniref:CLUMA_CG009013, isoform A n=1 Tax=Clunio marinus TaxID=568069 RepID=A0A1J1I7J4_9DIPT|nr:CLUMA_CG009013, isoform A [Clunio marinus]